MVFVVQCFSQSRSASSALLILSTLLVIAFASWRSRDRLRGMDTRERVSEIMENPEQVHELAEAVQEQGKQIISAVDDFVRRNPYLAMGIALAAGCAIASLIRSRD